MFEPTKTVQLKLPISTYDSLESYLDEVGLNRSEALFQIVHGYLYKYFQDRPIVQPS